MLFVGINPSLRSAEVGHHFARPGNRFYPALHAAGFTPRQLAPEEDGKLPWLTASASRTSPPARPAPPTSCTRDELRAGAAELEALVAGRSRGWWRCSGSPPTGPRSGGPRRRWGLQPETLGGRPVWILPNPSGLNAHYKPADFARLYGEARVERRAAGEWRVPPPRRWAVN